MAIQEIIVTKENLVPGIYYRNSEEVEEYLLCHPKISDFLKNIWPTLTNYFGQSVRVELEVVYYPDEMDEEELVGWIQYEGDVEEGLELLGAFEDEALESQLEYLGDAFFFNIAFV